MRLNILTSVTLHENAQRLDGFEDREQTEAAHHGLQAALVVVVAREVVDKLYPIIVSARTRTAEVHMYLDQQHAL